MSRYPDGIAGAGLLVLRFACAVGAFSAHFRLLLPIRPWGLAFAATLIVAVALIVGFGTRTAALLLVAATISVAFATGRNDALVIAHAACCAALALLGPGAYSIDANVFGRRVIRFEPRPRDDSKGK